jgi:hypothetical protein
MRLFLGTAFVVCAFLLVAHRSVLAQEQKTEKLGEFLIVSYKVDRDNHAVVISESRMRKVGTREFISGKILYVGVQKELEGIVISIPVDAISRFMEFTSANDAIRAAKLMNGESKQAPPAPAREGRDGRGVQWRTDYQLARKEAEAANVPLAILFTRPYGAPAEKLEHALNQHEKLVSLLNTKTIPLRIDIAASESLARSLAINLVPTLILADSKGKILRQEIGYQDPDELFARWLKVVSESCLKKQCNVGE